MWLKLNKYRGINVNILEDKVNDFMRLIEQKRISKLSRGSIRAQNGHYMSNLEWEKVKRSQKSLLEKVSKAFYPEKYKA